MTDALETLARELEKMERRTEDDATVAAAVACVRECIANNKETCACDHGIRHSKCPLCPDPVAEAEAATDTALAAFMEGR
jgi:hypothetical protein